VGVRLAPCMGVLQVVDDGEAFREHQLSAARDLSPALLFLCQEEVQSLSF
jgi:hypothetical protein